MQGLTLAWYGEIVAAGSPECRCVCVCVCERERERECVCVCVCVKWWGLKGGGWGVQMLEFDGQNSCDHFEPVLHPATKPSPSPPPRRGSSRCTPTRVPSGDTALSNIDRKRKKRIPANQDVTDCLPKLFVRYIVAASVNEKKIYFGGGDFSKKAENHF